MDNPIDITKGVDWLNNKWDGPKICPVCKSNNWNVSERPVELREFHRGGLTIGGPIYPLLAVTCQVCGNTILFNAIVAGLVVPEKPIPPETKPAEKEEK
jgi:predicted nucleic-acid-binding Zn-ribbon protein